MNPVGLGAGSLSVKREHYIQYITLTHTHSCVSHADNELHFHAQTQF